jgi:hypothetical protein
LPDFAVAFALSPAFTFNFWGTFEIAFEAACTTPLDNASPCLAADDLLAATLDPPAAFIPDFIPACAPVSEGAFFPAPAATLALPARRLPALTAPALPPALLPAVPSTFTLPAVGPAPDESRLRADVAVVFAPRDAAAFGLGEAPAAGVERADAPGCFLDGVGFIGLRSL